MTSPAPAVLRCVPHRAPILRVHDVVAADAAAAHVRGSEPAGPGALPWALGAIEGLAQSAAVLLAHGADGGATTPRPGLLVAVRQFAVHAEPPAGAVIDYHVRLVRRLGANARIAGHAESGGVRLAAGELTLWSAAAAGAP
ncbi:MAG: hypothetical protein QM775_25085 [Pirellulales bacterium]